MDLVIMNFVFLLYLASVVKCSIKLDFNKVLTPSKYTKRDALPMPLINDKILYTTELEIGSNKDKVSVSIDTGSYDLWVMSNDTVCYKVSEFQTEGAPQLPDIFNDIDQDYSCTFNGTYNSKSSKTFKNTSEDFSIGYVDGSAAQGVWGYDSVQFGQYGVTGLKIGIANRSSVSDGILGIGIANGYDNFPVLLQKQGLINKIAYSVYLNSSNSTTGTILFGAIDHAKYEGVLSTVPVDSKSQLSVNVTNLKTKNGNVASGGHSILLDTGSTFSIFPDEWIDALGHSLNATYDEDESVYEIECDGYDEHFFGFSIGDSDFSVPIQDLKTEKDGQCYLAIMSNSVIGGGGILFGDDILRRIYLVYDLQDMTISVAPVVYTEDEEIEEILNPNEDQNEVPTSTSFTQSASSSGSQPSSTISGENMDKNITSSSSGNCQTRSWIAILSALFLVYIHII